jgi:hypothetical protein
MSGALTSTAAPSLRPIRREGPRAFFDGRVFDLDAAQAHAQRFTVLRLKA